MNISVVQFQVEGSHYCCKQLKFDNLTMKFGWERAHDIIVFGKGQIGPHTPRSSSFYVTISSISTNLYFLLFLPYYIVQTNNIDV